tara:strand:- start:429 stop:881 length:453 start_codon:yes stop_codon:yes gene_type:complete
VELKTLYSGGNSQGPDDPCIKPCDTKSTVDKPIACDCKGYFCCRVSGGGEVNLQCRKPLQPAPDRAVFGGVQLDPYEIGFDNFTAMGTCNGITNMISLHKPNPLMPGDNELLFFEDNIPVDFPTHPWTITFSFYDAVGNLLGTKDWVATF